MSNSINSWPPINKKKRHENNIINKTVKTRQKNHQKRSIVDEIRERRPVPNPWRVGEVAQIIIKGNPEIQGYFSVDSTSGAWQTEIKNLNSFKAIQMLPASCWRASLQPNDRRFRRPGG